MGASGFVQKKVRERAPRTCARKVAGIAFLLLLCASTATAQDLVSQLRRARFQARAEELIRASGLRRPLMPLLPIPLTDSTLAARVAAIRPPAASGYAPPMVTRFEILKVDFVRRLERAGFERRFGGTQWAYLGNTYRSAVDTTQTWRLRAALQTQYGFPTRAISDLDPQERARGNHIQFEYWFIVNDTIPVIISDAGGPLDRGVVLSSDQSLRARLEGLRDALLSGLLSAPLSPFTDYFYESETRSWYLTGYDGERFVFRKINRPNLELGRPSPQRLEQ